MTEKTDILTLICYAFAICCPPLVWIALICLIFINVFFSPKYPRKRRFQ